MSHDHTINYIISIGFCYKRNNYYYNYDKGLKDNGYYPKKDQRLH